MKRLLFTILALCVLCVGLQAQNTNTTDNKGVTSQGQLDTVRNTRVHPTTQNEQIQGKFVDQFGKTGQRPGLSPYGQRLNAIIKVTSSSIVNNSVLATTASIAATVSDSGDYALPIIERGVCYATTANPTLLTATKKADATISGKGFGNFNVSLSGLQPHTAYHARAYAVSMYDTVYGTDLTFTTLFLAGSISYSTTVVEKMTIEPSFITPLTKVGDGTVTYSESGDNHNICTVNATTGEVTLTGNTGTCTITATVANSSSYTYATTTASYTLTVTPVGALPGKFTVNAGGGQVSFSQGNLQYQASTQTWRFAPNQYDMIGSDNANISNSYTGWIDLFGWGTGNNPTNSSTNNGDYSTFTDWGANAISNGGNTANMWSTLTKDEWVYLFEHHTKGWSTVNGVNGYVIRPDGISTAVAASYTASGWAVEEAAGSVFLPAAGSRGGTSVGGVGDWGDYWSSTPYNSNDAYYLYFNSSQPYPSNNTGRFGGRSVRLVYETPFFQGAGTEQNPYRISSEEEWNYLAVKVNSGTSYAGKFFRQTANINVTTMVGEGETKPFSGTYDGNGNTLNLNLDATVRYTAPFLSIVNGTIKNVVTTGSVHSTDNHPSGLVGFTDGTCTIQNCRVGASVSGPEYSGGIVGHCWHANISIIGCVYTGTLNPKSGQKTGGILGWGGDGGGHTIRISDCLFAGSLANTSTKFNPIGDLYDQNMYGPNTKLLSNTYYTLAANFSDEDNNSFVQGLSYKGKFARSIVGGTGVTVARTGATAVYDVSGITSYGTGILYDGVLYAGNGEEVSLTLSHTDAPEGFTFSQYTVTGGGSLNNPTSNSPTLTMTDANQTINAEWIPQGAISGKFSVSSTKQVYFSQGNLQATTSNKGSTWTWAFAEHQWDYIGNAVANNSINGNGTVANNGTLDLFGWSTAATTFGILNSTSSSNYSGNFVDWGSNIGTGWRTLTKDEWVYLFITRTSNSSVNGTSDARYAHATINTDGTGVNGLILFPDGVTIANNEATSWGNINATSSWAGATKCTSAQWTALAAKGCVFLPTAGLWFASVNYAGTNGSYWSSSLYDASYAYCVDFLSTYLYHEYWRTRSYRCSVRLVRDAN